MSKIEVYITVWWGCLYARVTGTRHSLAGFPIYPRYRYCITIDMGMY